MYSASGSVCVSPGMFETNVIVAPNSPSARANDKTLPAKIPGAIRGIVIVRKTRKRDAPSVLAAASSRGDGGLRVDAFHGKNDL